MHKIFSKIDQFFDHNWQLGILRPESGLQILNPDPTFIPYLKAQNARKNHILIRPNKTVESFFLLIDDVPWVTLESQHKAVIGSWFPGRFIVETSPKNFQLWLRFDSPLSLSKKIELLQHFKSDPACYPKSRFGRCPGFRNTKPKYLSKDSFFPLAKMIWIDYAKYADLLYTDFDSADLPARDYYEKGNESQTDFAFTLALLRRGVSDIEIKNRILVERSDWKNHFSESKKFNYLDRTIRKAKLVIGV